MQLKKDLIQEGKSEWKDVVKLPKEEAKKCRFACVNPSYRLFACITHNKQHGLRLHPPHLWVVKDGIVYKRVDNKLKVWYSFLYVKKKNNGTRTNRGNKFN